MFLYEERKVNCLQNNKIIIIYFVWSLTFRRESCNPGASEMHANIVPNNNIKAYIILVDVELRHDGQALQHNEHAALPQQQAN